MSNDARERLCIACNADVQLRIANEMLFAALNNLKALDVAPQSLRDYVQKSKEQAQIAMSQLHALIKRIP